MNAEDDSVESLATSRARRTVKDKHGRLAALQRLKGLKGSKNKYEVSEVDNVYEEVDEREYSKRRQGRLEDDWIVDDDGSGYIEDGREIFDEDNDDDDLFVSKKDKNGKKQKAKAKGAVSASHGSGSIKAMLMNLPTKRKSEPQVRLEEDDILGDILQDLGKQKNPILPPPTKVLKKIHKPSSGSQIKNVNPFSKPLVTTPIRSKTTPKVVKPRSITPENSACNSSPKAKRHLEIEEHPSQQIEECDTPAEMDFSDDMQALIEDDEEEEDCKKDELVQDEVPNEQSFKVNSNKGYMVKEKIDDSLLTSGWETIKGELMDHPGVKDIHIDSSQLPLTTNTDGKQVFRFYWFDAYEDSFNQGKGTIYLLGKVWVEAAKTYASCCVAVKNIERKIYLLPRKRKINLVTNEEGKNVAIIDVYEEFNASVSNKFKIQQFKSRKITKKYGFGKPGIPVESEYLEVCYSAEYPALPSDLCGQTFSHVFGTNTSSLELFLLERQIKGPGWLDVTLPQLSSPALSWCRIEAVVLKPEHVIPVSGLAVPPLVVMTVGMRTTLKPKTSENEICMISCLIHHEFPINKAAPQPPFQAHFCAMTHPSDVPWPWDMKNALEHNQMKIEKSQSERALLCFFLAKMHKIDPDVVVGHDILGLDLPILLDRIKKENIPHWSRLGRLKRTQKLKATGKGYEEKTAMCGRLLCDVKISAKELIQAKSYELAPLINKVLRVPETQLKTLTKKEVKEMYESSASLFQLFSLTMQDTLYILRLMCELNVLPLALQITSIAGNVMSRTLLGGRSERNEYLLLHAFTERNFIVPDKSYGKSAQKVSSKENNDPEEHEGSKGRRKPAYTGGLVLEPKIGFYDTYILLMDFNSLYPSIIQEYNICFTTIEWESIMGDGEALPALPDQELEPGVLPTEIRKLVESRKQVKQLMKQQDISSDLKLQYDIRQKALKLTANSMYGCLGFSHSRFYGPHLAALVTGKGREILMQTRDLVLRMNLEVIYGDTDSLMINTNCREYEEVFKMGHKIKSEVNKLYKLLELDIDGVYKYILLLKKKKYAALAVSRLPNGQLREEQELKGLDIVRRDWSQLASDCGKHIVGQILSDQGPEERIENIHSHLIKVKDDLEAGKIDLEKLAITKSLTKRPEDYPDVKSLPHVQVALRMNAHGGKSLRQGDTVSYVICEDGTDLPATQRAYHVDELKSRSSLAIDKKFYLANQIHPVVSRLCDPIDGTDAGRIADCLGLDSSGYKVSKQCNSIEEDLVSATQISDEEYFHMCERFSFECPSPSCDTVITMDSPFRGVGSSSSLELALQSCPNPKCSFPIHSNITSIHNKLRLEIRKHILRYYSGWLICEDPGCENRTRRVPLQFIRGFPICNLCERGVLYKEYTDSQLYKQLCFYSYVFDLQKACQKNKDGRIRDEDVRKAYGSLYSEVQKFLKQSAYSEVNLNKLF
ncbi:DNA polymerase alpha catalytic subunit-like [Scylla paramamosain]